MCVETVCTPSLHYYKTGIISFLPKIGSNLQWFEPIFERFCGGNEKLRQPVAVLPWSHNLLMLNKKLDDKQVLYYAHEVIAKGWSLNENGQRKFPR